MPFLMSRVAVVAAMMSVALVRGRSAPPPPTDAKDQSNLILLEAPGARLDVEGDTLLVKDKQFSSVQELGNVLADDRKGRSSQDLATPDPLDIVVPVASNFSSIKELFDILREDRAKPQRGHEGDARNQTYVRGTENSDFMIFFT